MSKSQKQPDVFYQHASFSTVLCASVAMFFLVFFVIGGASFLVLTFGDKYALGASVIAWLGLMQAFRIFRVAPTIVSTSRADTKKPMYANIVRTIALVLAIIFVYLDMSVIWVAISGVIGELVATLFAAMIVRMDAHKAAFVRLNIVYVVLMLLVFSVFYVSLFAGVMPIQGLFNQIINIALSCALGGACAIAMIFLDKNARDQFLQLPSLLRRRRNDG